MEKLLTAALGQGLYAGMFVFLLLWVLKKNDEREKNYQALISIIVWGSLLSIYATLRAVMGIHFWKIFLLGIPGQIAISLWFRMFRGSDAKKENTNG